MKLHVVRVLAVLLGLVSLGLAAGANIQVGAP